MVGKRGRNGGRKKKVTRYTYDEVKEPRVVAEFVSALRAGNV